MAENLLNEDFIDELFKLCLTNKQFLLMALQHLKLNYLPDDVYKELWKNIKAEWSLNKSLTSIGKLQLLTRNKTGCNRVLSKIKEVVIPDLSSTTHGFELFLKQNRFVEIYNSLGDLYNEDQKKKAFDYFVKEAEEFSNFTLGAVKFEKVFEGFMKRQILKKTQEKYRKIPFGIDELDDKTNGGAEQGEFFLFLGDSNVGKSILAVHTGIAAARRGYKIAHFQLEGLRRQVEDRYDAAWSGIQYKDIKTGDIEVEKLKKAKKVIENIGKGEIYVEAFERFGEATLIDVRNSLIEMNKSYGHIDRIVIDYLDLLDPGNGHWYKPSEEHHKLNKVAQGCKEIAMEFQADLISFSQISSVSPEQLNDPEFVLTRYNTAECKGKLRSTDGLITMNQTKDERKNKVMRLFADKIRDGDRDFLIYLCTNFPKLRFYDRKKTIENFIDKEV